MNVRWLLKKQYNKKQKMNKLSIKQTNGHKKNNNIKKTLCAYYINK